MSAAEELARAAEDYRAAQASPQAPAPEVIGGAAQSAGAVCDAPRPTGR